MTKLEIDRDPGERVPDPLEGTDRARIGAWLDAELAKPDGVERVIRRLALAIFDRPRKR